MAKIKITESELRELIRESVSEALSEDNGYMWTGTQQDTGNTAPIPTNTPNQQAKRDTDLSRDLYQQNSAANIALQRWNSLGTAGQIKLIQQLVGATPDGKLGPQTLGKIFMAVSKGSNGITTTAGEINPQHMGNTTWGYGKKGTYTNLKV